MAAEQHDRMYHSSALLLPDGRVISMGSGRRQGLANHKNGQIFTPPYLLTGEPRPVITGFADEAVLHYGGTAVVGIDPDSVPVQNLARMTLVRLGSATHQNNMDQRFVDLGCWTRLADDLIEINAPESENIAPPGYYMLFLLSDAGVPSLAAYVRVGT
jgi:galactose oxidase